MDINLIIFCLVILCAIIFQIRSAKKIKSKQQDKFFKLNTEISNTRDDNNIEKLNLFALEIEDDIIKGSKNHKESDQDLYELKYAATHVYCSLSRVDNKNYPDHIKKAINHYSKIPLDNISNLEKQIKMKLAEALILYQRGENEHNQKDLEESIEIQKFLMEKVEKREKKFSEVAWMVNHFLGCSMIFHPDMTNYKDDIRKTIQLGIELNKKAMALYIENYGYKTLPLTIPGKIIAGWKLLYPEGK